MIVPPKGDPSWRKFLNRLNDIQPGNLATRMLINRLKLKIALNPSEANRAEALDSAYEFFVKNQTAVANDIDKIFA